MLNMAAAHRGAAKSIPIYSAYSPHTTVASIITILYLNDYYTLTSVPRK